MKKLGIVYKVSDFAVSDTHPEEASLIEFNEMDGLKCWMLFKLFLQPVQLNFGDVFILSGKRTEKLNQEVGGVADSRHLFKEMDAAVDFTTTSNVEHVFQYLKEYHQYDVGELLYYKVLKFHFTCFYL